MAVSVSIFAPEDDATTPGDTAEDFAAASISDARISPPGPEPRTPSRLTCNSLASRRAFGEIFTFAPEFAASAERTADSTARAAGVAALVAVTAAEASSSGTDSPLFTIQAMVWPTAITSPSLAFTPAKNPSASASTSTTALSVSTSSNVSPLATASPSFLRQETSLPVSCVSSSAGITTLMAIIPRGKTQFLVGSADPLNFGAGLDHFLNALAGRRFGFARRGHRPVDGEIMRARDEQFLRWETRDDLVAGFGDHNFLFNARRGPSIGGRPEGFQSEYHSGLDLVGMIQRNQAADDRFFPDRQADAMSVLQSEGGFFVGESEFLRFRPQRRNFAGG